MTVGGHYSPIVGDFDGDGAHDIFWYGPGSANDAIWWSNRNRTFTKSSSVNVSGSYTPIAGDFD